MIHGSHDTVLDVSCAAGVARCLGGGSPTCPARLFKLHWIQIGGVCGRPDAATVLHIPQSGHKLNQAADRVVGAVINWVLKHQHGPKLLRNAKSRGVQQQAAVVLPKQKDLVKGALPLSPVKSPMRRVRLGTPDETAVNGGNPVAEAVVAEEQSRVLSCKAFSQQMESMETALPFCNAEESTPGGKLVSVQTEAFSNTPVVGLVVVQSSLKTA